MTLDPYREELIVRLTEKEGTHLVRNPIGGGAETTIPLEGEMSVASLLLYPNAVGKDGRILVALASPASWFGPVGLIEPKTGRVQVIRLGYDADMNGGWSPDGKLVVVAKALRVGLWRFRREAAAAR